MPQDNRRQYYRLRYPITSWPTIHIEGQDFKVAELSEHGIRILRAGDGVFPENGFAGLLFFNDGEQLLVRGTLLREEDREIVVQLHCGVPFKRMLTEQIYIRHKYPMYFQTILRQQDPTVAQQIDDPIQRST